MRCLFSAGSAMMIGGSALAGGGEFGLVVLNPGAEGALEVAGDSRVEVTARSVYVNSSHGRAVDAAGAAVLDAPAMHLVGGARFSGRSRFTGTTHQRSEPIEDPFGAVAFPDADSMENFGGWSINSGSVVTLSPGYYPRGISVSGGSEVSLDPGVYIFGGSGLTLTSGGLHGEGVTIVIESGGLSLEGDTRVRLSPPAEGATGGVVIAQARDNATEMMLAGGADMHITGAIYAPGARLVMVGNADAVGEGGGPLIGDTVVADRVRLSGTATVRIGRRELSAVSLPPVPRFD